MEPTFVLQPQSVFYSLHHGQGPLRQDNSPIPRFNRGTLQLERSSHGSNHGSNVDAKKAKLRKAAEGFEAIFVRKLLSTMRTTMSENSMFGAGISGEIYGDIIDSAVADTMAEKNVLGFADMLYRSMVKSVETVQ